MIALFSFCYRLYDPWLINTHCEKRICFMNQAGNNTNSLFIDYKWNVHLKYYLLHWYCNDFPNSLCFSAGIKAIYYKIWPEMNNFTLHFFHHKIVKWPCFHHNFLAELFAENGRWGCWSQNTKCSFKLYEIMHAHNLKKKRKKIFPLIFKILHVSVQNW